MARTAKSGSRGGGGRVGRPPGSGRATAKAAAGTRRVVRPPNVSKGELREQVTKLEATNARLRGKNRELGRAAKSGAARVAELEQQLAAMQRRGARPESATASRGGRTRGRNIDPGDAVPPGVAVEEPESPDEEALAAPERLEERFPGE